MEFPLFVNNSVRGIKKGENIFQYPRRFPLKPCIQLLYEQIRTIYPTYFCFFFLSILAQVFL